ncbi:MAG: B12-binding domain-containing radical SAM protein [Deltaproteobacteria bacterium]|nr:MAG: B12-binding domain-containing radical SAM protein [Deltaproteobacteria bacterium]
MLGCSTMMYQGGRMSRSNLICLIRPPAVESFRFVTTTITLPLGLAYIAAVLEEAGEKVQILDAVAESPSTKTRYYKGVLVGLTLEEIAARVPAEATMVGITVIFTHEWPAVVRLIELIRQRRPDIKIVVGGEHVTSMPEFCLATSESDYIVRGEGEETIVELVDAINNDGDLSAIPGLGYRDGDNIIINERRIRRKTPDEIPYPAWHLFDIKTYNDSNLVGGMDTGRMNLPLLATRGCPYQCTFCSSPNMWTPRWIPRDPIKVVDEIEHHVQHFNAGSFPFQDLTAIIQKDWIKTFCEEIIKRDLDISWQFPSGTRSEAIDTEVAELMKRTGMVSIAYAPESGSETTRRLIKKRMKTDNLMASIKASADADLNVACFMIIGFPHDTDERLAENYDFLKKIRKLGVTDLGVGYFFALPGTELFDSLYDAGKIRLDERYFAHILQGGDLVPSVSYCDHMSRLDLMKWKLKLYGTFYSTPNENKPRSGLLGSVRRALSGLLAESHDSKLQTVLRTAAVGGWDEIRVAPTRGWISRAEEKRMFERWDTIFRRIREDLAQQKVITPAPLDTTTLQAGNVMKKLKHIHGTSRVLQLSRIAA